MVIYDYVMQDYEYPPPNNLQDEESSRCGHGGLQHDKRLITPLHANIITHFDARLQDVDRTEEVHRALRIDAATATRAMNRGLFTYV